MYKFMLLILALVVTLFSSSCAPYPVVAKTSGLPFGTVITLGGKKMIVVSQENEKVRNEIEVGVKAFLGFDSDD